MGSKKIQIGDWIWLKNIHCRAVVVNIIGDWYYYRYKAIRCSDNKIIWVFNGDNIKYISFYRKGNGKIAKKVLKLKGPYGED
jgi:hypothetical protein